VVLLVLVGRSWLRLPAWEDNRAFLVTLLEDHPESYRGQQSAAAVLAGIGTPAAVQDAANDYARADSLFGGDPHLKAGFALFLLDHGDSASAGRLAAAARTLLADEPVAMRVQLLLARARGDSLGARSLADTLCQRLGLAKPDCPGS
jgi:hypothetical protein